MVAVAAASCVRTVCADENSAEPAPAFTATAAVATRYVSRGLDISQGPPVPQAGFEYANLLGLYVDGYAAKIRYFGMNAEIDGTVGYRGHDGRLNYDLGLYYSYYPGSDPALHSNFAELGTKFTWGKGPVVPVLEAYVSNNYFFGAGRSLFVWGGADFTLPADIVAGARIGHITVADNRAFVYPDYSTWLLSAAKQFAGFMFSLQLTDTSITRSECTNGSRCSAKLTLKIAKAF